MKRLCITEDWTQSLHAHRLLDEPWIRTTTFQEVADYMVESEDATTTGQPGAQRSELTTMTTTGATSAANINASADAVSGEGSRCERGLQHFQSRTFGVA